MDHPISRVSSVVVYQTLEKINFSIFFLKFLTNHDRVIKDKSLNKKFKFSQSKITLPDRNWRRRLLDIFERKRRKTEDRRILKRSPGIEKHWQFRRQRQITVGGNVEQRGSTKHNTVDYISNKHQSDFK